MTQFTEILAAMVTEIKNGAPHLRSAETAFNTVAETVAVFVPAAGPVVMAVEAAEKVVNEIIDDIKPLAETAESFLGSETTPVFDAQKYEELPTVDHASLAAGGVASSEAPHNEIVQRLMALENFVVSIAPMLGSVAKQLGI